MSILLNYKKMVVESLHSRLSGDAYGEDQILEILDRLWAKMTPAERDEADAFCGRLAKSHLDQSGRVIAPLDDISLIG